MSRKNTSSSQETLTRAEIRSRRRIICSTPNITSGLLPLRRPRRRSHRAVSSDRLERTRTTWKTTAILARCRIVSPRLRSGRTLIQQPQQGFQPQPSAAPNAPQPFGDRPAYEAERQGGNDRGGFAPRQDRQGNRFPDRGPRPDRPFQERNEGYRDNRHGRDGRPRDFRPYRDPQPQPAEKPAADAAAPPGFPPS